MVTEPHREKGKALLPAPQLTWKQSRAVPQGRSLSPSPAVELSQGRARDSCDSREVLRSCEGAPVAGALPPGSPHGLRGKSGSRTPPALGHCRLPGSARVCDFPGIPRLLGHRQHRAGCSGGHSAGQSPGTAVLWLGVTRPALGATCARGKGALARHRQLFAEAGRQPALPERHEDNSA